MICVFFVYCPRVHDLEAYCDCTPRDTVLFTREFAGSAWGKTQPCCMLGNADALGWRGLDIILIRPHHPTNVDLDLA